MYPPFNNVRFHFPLNCLRAPNRVHLTSCRVKNPSRLSHLFPFFPPYLVFHYFVLIPCFIWLLEPETLAFGTKSLWANTLCVLESKSITPVCTSNCAPLQSPEPVLKLEPEEICRHCRLPGGLCRAGLYWFELVPVFCQLAILSQALIPHYLNCKFHEHIIMLQVHPGLKLTILDQCLKGTALNFNNTIKFLEWEIYPDCRFCIFCTFSMWSYPHRIWAQCSCQCITKEKDLIVNLRER